MKLHDYTAAIDRLLDDASLKLTSDEYESLLDQLKDNCETRLDQLFDECEED